MSEFEASRVQISPKSLTEIKHSNYLDGNLKGYQMNIADTFDIPTSIYLSCLTINRNLSILEDTIILKKLLTDKKLIFSNVRDISFFIGNRGFVKANCFDFYTDSLINKSTYGLGKIIFTENKPLYFCYTLNGKKRSSSSGYKCVGLSKSRRLSIGKISKSLF